MPTDKSNQSNKREAVAIALIEQAQIMAYQVLNFFGKHIVKNFFDHPLNMGTASILAVLSVVLFLCAAWMFAGGVAVFVKSLMFRVDMVNGMSEALVKGIACIVLSIFAKGTMRLSHKVLAATDDEE